MLSQESTGFRYFIELAFNGKFFHGWQVQPNAITVQEVLNQAFTTLLGESVNLVGAGRTDTGVHASHYVAHMNLSARIIDTDDLVFKANRFLPGSIRIDKIAPVSPDLHARFSAVSRTYNYIISRHKSPFMEDFSWILNRKLDFQVMKNASETISGFTDFTSFARLHSDNKTNECNILSAGWEDYGDYWIFSITADRFLRNMVRAIVGTMVEAGIGKISLDDLKIIIASKDRSAAGQSAPPQGLFLTHIQYPAGTFNTNPASPFIKFF